MLCWLCLENMDSHNKFTQEKAKNALRIMVEDVYIQGRI